MQIDIATIENSIKISLKTKQNGIKLPYDPAIPLLGKCPEETVIEKDTNIVCAQSLSPVWLFAAP